MEQAYSELQRRAIDSEFGWIQDKYYLDNAGAALYSSKQMHQIGNDLCQNLYGNPHTLNISGKSCTDAIDKIRFRILQFFHTTPDEYSVIFTSGATAAIKLLVESFFSSKDGPGGYVYTASNHTSIIGGREIARSSGAFIECLDIDAVDQLMTQPIPPKSELYREKCLFAYPAQCNFSGAKYPLDWISRVKKGILNNQRPSQYDWYTLLDAAGYCSTNELNLSSVSPDFVCLSFYKIFGYPTGLGALLVKNTSASVLEKRYFGGGSVDIALPSKDFYKPRKNLHERFEDGTLPYLSIIALGHGFDTLERLQLTMSQISVHVFNLASYAVNKLRNLRHWNQQTLVEIYAEGDFNDIAKQGGVVAFNLKRADGSYIGYVEVLHIADSYKIHLRTGCFCNIGACQRYLSIPDEQLLQNYQSGHICGDDRDVIEGKPTGAIRVSFGLSNSSADVDRLIDMLQETFIEKAFVEKLTTSREIQEQPVLTSIRLYPVKSCGPMIVNSWKLTQRGLYMDRQWMVITSAGTCLTQKQEPLLCLIMPAVELESGVLTLTYNGTDPITLDLNQRKPKGYQICRNKVCGDKVDGVDCGDKVADWLSRHLSRDGLRLVHQHERDKRAGKNDATLSLVNQAQYLLINQASVDWLRDRLHGEEDFDPTTLEDRFRANFIISGIPAFDEFKLNQLEIGAVTFQVDGPCSRCQMICIDQKTGRLNRRPLVELSRGLEGKHRFGIYCSHTQAETSGQLEIGNTVNYKYYLN